MSTRISADRGTILFHNFCVVSCFTTPIQLQNSYLFVYYCAAYLWLVNLLIPRQGCLAYYMSGRTPQQL